MSLLQMMTMVSTLKIKSMNSYHVTFIPEGQTVATGKRYDADSPIKALYFFSQEYPGAVFLYIASSEMFTYKYGY